MICRKSEQYIESFEDMPNEWLMSQNLSRDNFKPI